MSLATPTTGRIQFPPKAKVLFQPAPYKVLYGGRGGSKSWDFVRAALILGANRKLFILCTREVQNSIEESVYKLIVDQIDTMGLNGFYIVMDTEIRAINGTRFVFAGLKNQFRKIKSYEAIDLCIVFEATHISDPAWETLLPTVRRDPPFGPFGQGSEIWVEFNPELVTDATYKRWVLRPPEGTICIEINYWDNPWFPQILRRQMEEMKVKDYDAYQTVWCGKTRRVLAGAIYAKEIAAALADDPPRINPNVKWDKTKAVIISFDLGRSDTCSLWFFQQYGMEYAVIRYYGNTGFDFSHYLDYIDDTGYRVKKIILPHDAKQKVLSAKSSVLQQARDAYGRERVPKPLPATSAMLRINAARGIFPRLYFAEEETQEGVQGLQHYQYAVNDKGQRSQQPLHNYASHPANSLEHFALSTRPDLIKLAEEEEPQDELTGLPVTEVSSDMQNTSWMS